MKSTKTKSLRQQTHLKKTEITYMTAKKSKFTYMKKIFIALFLFIGLLQVSCSPETVSNSPTTKPVDVYVAGSKDEQACYWKNGQVVMLDQGTLTGTVANKIIVSNGNVYVMGYEKNNHYNTLFWKNGVLSNLNTQFNSNFLAINDFDVVGNDVYICGYSSNNQTNGYVFGYWKNGNRIILNDNTRDHYFSYIKVLNNNVYTTTNFPNRGFYVNNIFKPLINSRIEGIAVNNDKVYVYGSQINSGFYYDIFNNVDTTINFPTGAGNISAMCFDNNNIYYTNHQYIINKNSTLFDTPPVPYFISDFKVVDNNLYKISTASFGAPINSQNITINNTITLTTLTGEAFNSLFIVQN